MKKENTEHQDFKIKKIEWVLKNFDVLFPPFQGGSFFSKEMVSDIWNEGPGVTVINGALFTKDRKSKYINYKNGMRYTAEVPDVSCPSIYLLGSSHVYGLFCDDANTIASHLQYACNQKLSGEKYAIKNYGTSTCKIYDHTLQLLSLPLKKGDKVIVISTAGSTEKYDKIIFESIISQKLFCSDRGVDYCLFLFPRWRQLINPSDHEKMFICNSEYDIFYGNTLKLEYKSLKKYTPPTIAQDLIAVECSCFDLQPYFNRPHVHGDVLIDRSHVGSKGNKIIADAIFNSYILRVVNKNQINVESAKIFAYENIKNIIFNQHSKNKDLSLWIDKIRSEDSKKYNRIGAIVMNCNPFTNGHLYIIEKSLKSVDFLYIIVVQENLSDFSFEDRINLIKAGTAHIANRVSVVPSGKYIISSFTFPEYFSKNELQGEVIDTSYDVLIFGSVVAPLLGISCRFIGEEPYCKVTNQYNLTMKAILPKIGVEVIENPRMEIDGVAVSASLVRKLAQERKFGELEKLVPKTTFDFLCKNYLIVDNFEAFPNKKQKFLIKIYSPFVKIFANDAFFAKFKKDPSDFFASTKHPFNNILKSMLLLIGPEPKKTNYKTITEKK